MMPSTMPYLDRLSTRELAFLARYTAYPGSPEEIRLRWHAAPEEFDQLLRSRALFNDLFEATDPEALVQLSPFLVFAVLMARASSDVMNTAFVDEWLGPGRRVPVFHVDELQQFAADPAHRLFLADLLASYTRVASGSVWERTARGWRRRRFSDLDPVRLIEMLDLVPESEQSAIYRRLGDLMLFLTGVFPEHTWRRFDAPNSGRRLRRALSWHRLDAKASDSTEVNLNAMDVLESVGSRSYRQAWKATRDTAGPTADILQDFATGFGQARRLLNFVTDRFIFPQREAWFSVD